MRFNSYSVENKTVSCFNGEMFEMIERLTKLKSKGFNYIQIILFLQGDLHILIRCEIPQSRQNYYYHS